MTARQKIDEAVLDEYAQSDKRIIPVFPWVLVRTLKREHQVGLVITPERQNKPMIEGIVVEVWREPPARFYNVNSSRWEKPELYESELHIGDHVLFQYSAGMPAWGYDPGEWRLVKECNWEKNNEGGIVAVIREDDDISDQLRQMVQESHTASGPELAELIMDRYILIEKDKPSITLSGV